MSTTQQLDRHGSFLVVGSPWATVNARGPLADRQATATKAGVCCYVEQHLNAAGPGAKPSTNYACAIMPANASVQARAWGRAYVAAAAKEFSIGNGGVIFGGRGSGNIARMRCPAMLVEPAFVSSPDFARYVATGEVLDALARILVKSITDHFDPGIVGLSVGHLYRGTGDKGANLAHAPDELLDPAFDQEAEICDQVINIAQQMFGEIR